MPSVHTEPQRLHICADIHAYMLTLASSFLCVLHSVWNTPAVFFLPVQMRLHSRRPSSLKNFLNLTWSTHTHTFPPCRILPFVLLDTFLPFTRLVSFFSYSKEDLYFCHLCFPSCIVDNTDVTIIYIHYHYPCCSYSVIKWWETQRLLCKYLTRKWET